MIRGLVLVEGQTEERFVKQVLRPHFWDRGLDLAPTIVMTKKVKAGPSFRGGITSFGQFERDAHRLLKGASDAVVTTMLDYYALPNDFPGMSDRPNGSPRDRVLHVESAIEEYFGNPSNFKAFLTLHEFEALLFSSVNGLVEALAAPSAQADLMSVMEEFASPEDINERPGQSPSHRIQAAYPAYRKLLHGPTAAERIGLAAILNRCGHFADFVDVLDRWASVSAR